MSRVMNLVNKHGNGWRYEYNAHKSAILDHGVNKRTHDHNAVFNLGGKKVLEKDDYNHLRIKACMYENYTI